MNEHPREQHLQSLRGEAGRALRARAMRLASLPILAASRDTGSRRETSPAPSTSPGAATTRKGPMGAGAVAGAAEVEAPREERTVRALAKEIKRLLTEDRRRGLGVGG